MDTTVRLATSDDHAECLALDKMIMGTDRRSAFLRTRIERGEMYVAVEGTRIVGLAAFHADFVGCLYIALLLVHPNCRRKGIARRLVDTVAAHSTNGKLFSSTEEDNEVSIAMHEALGFRKSGYIENLPQPSREIIYYKDVPQAGS